MDINFSSEEELYKRLLPALRTKKTELNRHGYKYINEKDIYNYLKINKWTKSTNLTLYDMVDGILNTDNLLIDAYIKNEKLNHREEIHE